MSIEYRITIAGPGKCVNIPFLLIQDALKTLGWELKVENSYPPDSQMSLDWAKSHPGKTVVKVEHWPWGG